MEDDYNYKSSSQEKEAVLIDKGTDKAITHNNDNKNNNTLFQTHQDRSEDNRAEDTNENHSTINISVGDAGAETSEAGYGVSSTELLVSRDGSFSYAFPMVHQHHHTGSVSGIVMQHHHTDHHHHHRVLDEVTSFPAAMSYATSEAAKSDIATICSGSVVEDIDISSVMSGDMGNANPTTPSSSQVVVVGGGSGGGGGGGRKKDRVVETTLNMWKQHNIYPLQQQHIQPTSLHQSPPGSTSGLLNDMGPPLSRTLLLKCTGVTLGANSVLSASASGCGERNSTGTISRAGSVRSYGSQATSDLVHVDTDDCGGSLIESDGKCSRASVEAVTQRSTASPIEHQQPKYSEDDQDQQHNYLETEKHSCDAVGSDSKECLDDDCEKACIEDVSTSPPSNTNNLLCDARLSGPNSHGRTSPGGTVYKGRGVRRYQGRYMHLPLKRFHQNGVTEALNHHEYVDDACNGGEGVVNDTAVVTHHEYVDDVCSGGAGVINDGDAIGRDNGQSFSSNMYEGDSTAFTRKSNEREDQRHQQYREYRTQWRSWSRSRSRSRSHSRERIEGHCGGDERGGRNRFWNHHQSRSQPRPLPTRSSNYTKNRSPSWGREKWKSGGSGDNSIGRWRNNNRGWHYGNNCSNAKGKNNRGCESTSRHRNGKNSNYSRRGESGGYYRGGHQSQGMTPRDARHNRDRRK